MTLYPKKIEYLSPFDLQIIWNDDHTSLYHAKPLRLECPCATCVDEFTREKTIKPDLIPNDVRPTKLDYIGHYALAIHWSDGHSTGYYTFETLRALCQCKFCLTNKGVIG